MLMVSAIGEPNASRGSLRAVTYRELRSLCLSLPEVEERETWGEMTFRVREEPADEGADDPDDDVAEQPQTVAQRDAAGEKARHQPDETPDQDRVQIEVERRTVDGKGHVSSSLLQVERAARGLSLLVPPAAEADHPQQEQKDHRAHERAHHRRDQRVAGELKVDLDDLRADAAEERAEHAGHQVAQQPKAVTKRDPAGERSGDQTDQDPDKDRVHVEADVNHFTDSLLNRRTGEIDHAALAASSCSTAPKTRLNAGKGWMTSARVRSGVPAFRASTSSPRISPARGVTSVAPMSTPRSRSAISFKAPSWKSWM